MRMEDIISQLESIRANSASFLDPEDSDSIWQKDIEALDEIITILKGMEQESRWKRFLFRIQYLFGRRFRWTGGCK